MGGGRIQWEVGGAFREKCEHVRAIWSREDKGSWCRGTGQGQRLNSEDSAQKSTFEPGAEGRIECEGNWSILHNSA